MEDGKRIVKVEANVDAHSMQLNRIENDLIELRTNDLRDLRLSLEKLRDVMDQNRNEQHKEHAATLRWMFWMILTYGLAAATLVGNLVFQLATR